MCLKAETVNLAVSVELPLVIADIQRGGPSTGLPTKTEQADLLMALYGRNSDSPVPIIAPRTPADCFHAAFEAVRIATKYMTPVIVLSDGYLANGAEPWLIPRVADLPEFTVTLPHRSAGLLPLPARRDDAVAPVGGARHTGPRASHRRHREGVSQRQRQLRAGEPRADGARARPQDRRHRRRDPAHRGPRGAAGRSARRRLGQHLRRRLPRRSKRCSARASRCRTCTCATSIRCPATSGTSSARFKQVLVPEMNLGQLVKVLRAEYLVDAVGLNKIQGQPFKVSEIVDSHHPHVGGVADVDRCRDIRS